MKLFVNMICLSRDIDETIEDYVVTQVLDAVKATMTAKVPTQIESPLRNIAGLTVGRLVIQSQV